MGAPSGGNNQAVLDLVNSKFSGPSEAGNAAVADSVRLCVLVFNISNIGFTYAVAHAEMGRWGLCACVSDWQYLKCAPCLRTCIAHMAI